MPSKWGVVVEGGLTLSGSIERAEPQHDQRRHPAIGVLGQDFGFVDGPQHGVVPGLVAAGLHDAAAGDGAVGGHAHFHLGARVADHVAGVGDVGFDAADQAAGITGGRA